MATPIPAGKIDWDPTGDTSDRFWAGMGKAFHDPYLRLKQLTGHATQQEVDEAAQRDKALMNTGAGLAGNIVGSIAETAPLGALGTAARALPALRGLSTAGRLTAPMTSAASKLLPSLAQGVGQGAVSGAMQPVTSDETAAGNIAGGGILGGLGQGVAHGAQALVRPAIAKATPIIAALARKAEELGIPLSAAQISQTQPGKFLTSAFGAMPFGGSGALAEKQLGQYTKKLTGTFGPEAENAVKAVGQAKQTLGNEFDRLSGSNEMYLTGGDVSKLDAIPLEHAARTGDLAESNRLMKVIETVKQDHTDRGGVTPGDIYQSLRSDMGKNANAAPAGSIMQDSWNKVQGVLDDAMFRGMTPEDQAAWKAVRVKYANMKTVEKALPTSGDNAVTGTVNPEKMMSIMSSPAAKNEYARRAMQSDLGTSDLADIAQVGNAFVSNTPSDMGFGHLPFAEQLKSMGKTGAALGTAGVTGFGAAHLMPQDSEMEKHPWLTAAGATALAGLGGVGVGRPLNSALFRKGAPMLTKGLQAAMDRGVPGSVMPAALHADNAANANPHHELYGTQENNPFAGMQELSPEEVEGSSTAGMKEVPAAEVEPGK